MKKATKIIVIALCLVTLVGVLAGCNKSRSLSTLSKIKETAIELVEITSADSNTKTFTTQKYFDDIIAVFDKAQVKKYDKKTDVVTGFYVVKFYFAGEKGHIAYTLNKGFEAVDGCKVKIDKSAFFVENYDEIVASLNSIFYSGLND